MNKICGYSCEHNKSGVCQISVCDKKSIISDKTEVQTLRLDELDYTIVPNSDIKPLLDKLQQENKKLNGTIQTYDILLKANFEENKKLKDNWNKLKEWVNKYYDYYTTEKDYIGGGLCFTDMKNKMQELEQGSDE